MPHNSFLALKLVGALRSKVAMMQRKMIIHRSLYKPILFVGCERLPFTIVVTIGGVFAMAYQTLWMMGLILIFYLLSLILIRRINENDPQFFKCLYRYLTNFNDFYPANANYPGKVDNPQSHFE